MTPPPEWVYLLDWFYQLHNARGQGFSGPEPIKFSEIEAWSRLTRIQPGLFEIDCLRDIDEVFMRIYAKEASKIK